MPLSDEERKERKRESLRKWYKKNRKKVSEKSRKWYKENRERARETGRKWYKENRERAREVRREYQEKNRERAREVKRKYREKNPERVREAIRKWKKENPELIKSHKKKYYEKNPEAQTVEMTKYRRSHRECEWSYCEQTKSLHVHHILPQHKYPEYVDGNYHGRIANNIICYCPFHHFAYHFAYSTKRTAKKHKLFLPMLWVRVEQWANNNKISIEGLEIEIASFL